MIDYVNNSVLIVPNNLKEDIIKDIRLNHLDLNIKVLSLEELIKKLTFDYDEETIYQVMKLENVNYNIAKLYLKNIYYSCESNNSKLNHLFNLKLNIDDFLIKDTMFFKWIKNKEVIIYGYDYITKYQKHILGMLDNVKIIEKNYNHFEHNVYSFDTLENEVIFICEEISKLLSSGIDIKNIFISNLDNNYYNVVTRIFDMYDIPINLNNKNNIYQTSIGKYFINNLNNNIKELLLSIEDNFDMKIEKNKSIYNKLVDIINKFCFCNDYISIKENIVNVMKKTYINNTKFNNAVNEIDIFNNIIDDKKYVFLVGFNLNKIPVTIKDEDYITDNIKPSYIEKSYEMNLINKELYYKIIGDIKNLVISFKNKHLNESFYPSLLIQEYNMNVIGLDIPYSNYSNILNKIKLCKSIDSLIKFNIYNSNLDILYNNYSIPYMKYDNKFNGIDNNKLYKFLNNNFNLSYSSMDNYYHCAFKFYISNILKLDIYESTIQTYIGNLFHFVLSKAFDDCFDFRECVQYYINNNSYEKTYKNSYFINKVLDELEYIINIIKYQNTLMNMDCALYEKKINVEKNRVININFKGFIDKLLFKDNYVVIIDYKTYMLDINLKYLPYGLSMQLPVYLYLTKNLNKDYEIIGFYLQQVLFGKFNKDNKKTLKELKKDNLKLKGYTLGKEELIEHIDSTYTDSELIHGMKITSKGFGPYSRVLTNKEINNIVKITDEKIEECIDGIINAMFDINPKKISGKNIGCDYCKFKDICFMTNKDVLELKDIKDLSFLE